MNHKKIRFGDLGINQEFECYGDVDLNYSYPKVCKCIKTHDRLAKEIDGISFGMGEDDEVFIKTDNIKKTSQEWMNSGYKNKVTIIDADGWNESDYDKSWAEPITEKEFNKRLSSSTCQWSIHAIKSIIENNDKLNAQINVWGSNSLIVSNGEYFVEDNEDPTHFILIKHYPDSPLLGTVTNDGYSFVDKRDGGNSLYYPSRPWFMQYPEYWKGIRKNKL